MLARVNSSEEATVKKGIPGRLNIENEFTNKIILEEKKSNGGHKSSGWAHYKMPRTEEKDVGVSSASISLTSEITSRRIDSSK